MEKYIMIFLVSRIYCDKNKDTYKYDLGTERNTQTVPFITY
jgi:hypothetical protein